jgi:type II secretory pathway pseudopilin PulG
MQRGFSLVEVLVATCLMTIALITLAQLTLMSGRAARSAAETTSATILAAQKLEQLRALAWTFDAAGVPVSDTSTDTASVPENSSGGTGLRPGPSGALDRNADGYFEFLDAGGRPLGAGPAASGEAAFVRRWSIDALPADTGDMLVIQVVVLPASWGGSGRPASARSAGAARLTAMRTRTGT